MLNENEGLEEHILVYVLDKFLMLLLTKYRAAFSLPYLPKKKRKKKRQLSPTKWEEKDTLKWGCVVEGVPNPNYWVMPSPTS